MFYLKCLMHPYILSILYIHIVCVYKFYSSYLISILSFISLVKAILHIKRPEEGGRGGGRKGEMEVELERMGERLRM